MGAKLSSVIAGNRIFSEERTKGWKWLRSRDHRVAKTRLEGFILRITQKAYPEAARERDVDGCLPLHYAASYNFHKRLPEDADTSLNPSVAVIAELLKAYPEAARERDNDGCLPLHAAAYCGSSVAVIAELLKAYPEAARERDNHPMFRPHSTDSHGNRVQIDEPQNLLNLPQAPRDGRLPLHAACTYQDVFDVGIRELWIELLKAYPEAACGNLKLQRPGFAFESIIFLNEILDLPFNVIKSSFHPLRTCIDLSASLREFSSSRSENIELAKRAGEKAAELEQLACSIACNIEGEGIGYFGPAFGDCLRLAANLGLKHFISETICYRYIEREWGLSRLKFLIKNLSLRSPFLIAEWMFWYCLGCVAPQPVVRFLLDRASYLAYLVCIMQLPVQVDPGGPIHNVGTEIALAYWLFDICFSEAVEFCGMMRMYRLSFFKTFSKYAKDPWNIYDVFTLSTAVAAACVRGLVNAEVGYVTAADSNQLCAWALALMWGKLVNVLSVSSFTGPLLIMIFTMVFRDLSKFAFFVVLMEMPFVAALYFLESGEGGNESFSTFPESALSFLKILIGQGPEINSVTASSSILLFIGYVLLSVLMLNLLIALFSKTFETIIENSTQEYLLRKAQLTFTWTRASRLPPPFTFLLALIDGILNIVATGLGYPKLQPRWDYSYPVARREDTFPVMFDKYHFYRIVFPKGFFEIFEIDRNFINVHDNNVEKTNREEQISRWMHECDVKYEVWCKQVLDDFAQKAESKSEAQIIDVKQRVLHGMETTVESSSQINQIAENAKAIKEQMKVLSDAVQSHHADIQQMHASMKLILQKLNS
jgi:hypothetical protein